MLAVMLFDHFGAPRGFQGSDLPGFAAQVEHAGLQLLLEIEGIKFQFFDVQEHCETSAPVLPASFVRQARGSTPRGVSTARNKT